MKQIKNSTSSQELVREIESKCLLTRTRRMSRILTSIYDQALRPFGVNSPQFTLLVLISRIGPASRADIGRENHQERSTLTRNLQIMLAEGWIEEVPALTQGRSRPVAVTAAGHALLQSAAPAWRSAQSQANEVLGKQGAAAILGIAQHLDR